MGPRQCGDFDLSTAVAGYSGGADLTEASHLLETAAALAGARLLGCDTAIVCERDLMLH